MNNFLSPTTASCGAVPTISPYIPTTLLKLHPASTYRAEGDLVAGLRSYVNTCCVNKTDVNIHPRPSAMVYPTETLARQCIVTLSVLREVMGEQTVESTELQEFPGVVKTSVCPASF